MFAVPCVGSCVELCFYFDCIHVAHKCLMFSPFISQEKAELALAKLEVELRAASSAFELKKKDMDTMPVLSPHPHLWSSSGLRHSQND